LTRFLLILLIDYLLFFAGCAPSGFVTFLSKAYGGRVTDCHMTTDSGILSLLEPGDTVLADKGFPYIAEDASRRGAFLVMPPFKRGERQFSEKENADCYNVAQVRIHVERAIGRMKHFKILQFLEHSLFQKIDKILVCIGYLVNHLPPLIKDKD
jgi:hypothetical protein